MVDPVQNGTNFFLAFFNLMPSPIRLLVFVAAAFAVIAVIVRLVLK